MNDKLKKLAGEEYVLPDTQNKLIMRGSPEFLRDMREILDIMVHSPTALKLLNFNASLSEPLAVEKFKDALDLGRNTGKSIQLAHGQLANGKPVSKYQWLTLLPHEIRHCYNAPVKNSKILHALAYAIVNEADAQAIEGLIALELNEYLEKNKENIPNAEDIQYHLNSDPKVRFFKKFYDGAKGTDLERKAQAMTRFVKEFAKYPMNGSKSTYAELCYKTALERDTTADGWEKCSDEELEKIEDCLLGRINPETIKNEPWMKGRKKLSSEKETIQKEWPTFCKRIMDGTFNTDVIQYGQGIRPSNLVETISPQLANHFHEIGIIPQIPANTQQNSGRN
ncbi:MAG: hypothetical protein II942_02555 [Alphaproteobacteria bacterium]|nr:hypothetical protein [Alphaproteobacteria bacterium]